MTKGKFSNNLCIWQVILNNNRRGLAMLEYAIGIFLVAAVGGLIMALMIFKGRMAPWALSLLHMLLGATGLVLAGIAAMTIGGGVLLTGLVVLLGAATGGFYLASIHLDKELAPKPAVVVHAMAGVGGVVLLLIALIYGT